MVCYLRQGHESSHFLKLSHVVLLEGFHCLGGMALIVESLCSVFAIVVKDYLLASRVRFVEFGQVIDFAFDHDPAIVLLIVLLKLQFMERF